MRPIFFTLIDDSFPPRRAVGTPPDHARSGGAVTWNGRSLQHDPPAGFPPAHVIAAEEWTWQADGQG
ncbi:MAG TPA: hypothetical protein VFY16_08900 [Gemmatimonadaceae bacterium]|nr:hypothetical protein [Gemmatimonadaceae bacterium]